MCLSLYNIIFMVTQTNCSMAGFVLLFMFSSLPLCDPFYGAGLAPSAHTVDEMNSSCSDRGNSVCRRRFPNAPGPREGLPCGSTQGLFPDQDFSPQCGPQRGDLRQRAKAGLEGRARPPTRLARKMDPLAFVALVNWLLLPRLIYLFIIIFFTIHLLYFPADNQVSPHPSESRVGS